ncbi:hypothetical protein G7Z17_g13604 [Cylindrodendrum hubeiense]|uniref:Uncharacterized protein n=1 Tax=Cylindrodendrum hubeiense TaxID=595255 RepID=A0A9P5H0P9_9HYPO|nr:hypothetical protein G7Z17_g13604 [Cylindrodendrum hubeiense]
MDEHTSQSWQGSRVSRAGTRSSPGLPQQRRFDESWVEVSSQPSSSSLSSIGDEIVTTGLRVGGPYTRRRRLQPPARSLPQQPTAIHATTAAGASSPEEDEESESESEDDQVLTSSTENMHPSEEEMDLDSDADSDGDNVTALGRVSDQPVFRPQPNAFSHPQTHQRSNSAASAMPPPPHPHSGFTRPSFSQRSQVRPNNTSPNFMSPSIREENDAALRASLTTLLSCAAAARGLPKSKEEVEAHRTSSTGVGPSSQPMGLRLVPESELDAEPSRAQHARHATPSPPRKRGSPTRSASADKAKHGAVTGSVSRATKKKKTAQSEETLISPTLLTWVVSAGVVVLVSVVGFGAGYVIGREVGKQEALAVSVGGVNETTSCGGEVIRSSGNSLRRLRWGAVGKSIVA